MSIHISLYKHTYTWIHMYIKINVCAFMCMHAWALGCFSYVQLFLTPWTVPQQAPLSMGFSRQEYWSELPCPPPRDLPDPGIETMSLMSPALVGGFLTTSTSWEAHICVYMYIHLFPSCDYWENLETITPTRDNEQT